MDRKTDDVPWSTRRSLNAGIEEHVLHRRRIFKLWNERQF